MGRKCLAPLRKEEILNAFERCIEKYGVEGSSTRQIAAEAGMRQSILAHYFGSKKALFDALIERITDAYVRQLREALLGSEGDARIERLLDFLFGSGLRGSNTERNLIGRLLAAAAHDEALRARMNSMYQSFFDHGVDEIAMLLPDSEKDQQKERAYGLLCLAVGNDAVLSVDLPYSNRLLARRCADSLIQSMKSKT